MLGVPQTAAANFAGPLTANPAAGASQSLLSQFPEVEEALILAVIGHTLKPSDLYKLDSKYRDKAERGMLEIEGGTLRVKADTTTKDYPTPYSVQAPLLVYIRILIAHATGSQVAAVARATTLYLAQFLKLCAEYEWAAVLNYHMAFFAHRRREMVAGDYAGWCNIDVELQADYLTGFRKSRGAATPSTSRKAADSRASEVCRMFNTGVHTGMACPNGRVHRCSTPGCNSTQHGANMCTFGAAPRA
ncbi:hypothetical protein LshimejAT787_3700060 [Lyophyllum shimeji]|uniref:Uncharacterized protein n=1 Tax=Lyophyllum shimeji TaxID=47721 RepID=A0A9P3PYJ4_LYOSH|nr:hypothetical protein LshimejAT787_2200900 [Lyophyllum shimeji]GLB45903.1 hypothetical protein LshimejAT787_3700060 [Lyophyllum shimeji]